MAVLDEINFRDVDAERDTRRLERFDASFTTDRIYHVELGKLNATFIEQPLAEPLTKRYDLSGIRAALAESDLALIGEIGGEAAGFMTVKFEAWNRRAWITHLYVGGEHRGYGVGKRFIEQAQRFAERREARGLWLETQNFNYPAIQFYLKVGFRFCGFDESLYDPTVVPGETAIYFSRDL